MARQLHIAIVDDSYDDREVFTRMLKTPPSQSFAIETATNGKECLDLLGRHKFDCVLLDYNLPSKDGLRILDEIHLKWPDVAVVMLTGEGNEQIAVQALKAGAQDYVPKGDLSAARLNHAIDDALMRKKQEIEYLYQASHDELTGLPNRRMFGERLEHALMRSGRSGKSLALLYLDLDGFKAVNDTHGHAAGDALLQQVARRIEESLREYDTPARFGGDEFVILLEDLPADGVDRASLVAQRTTEALAGTPYFIDGHYLRIGVSVGIALYPLMAKTADELFKIADQGMYAMKHGELQTPSVVSKAERSQRAM